MGVPFPEPIPLILGYKGLDTIYLNPITAGSYANILSDMKDRKSGGLSLEKMVFHLLTEESRLAITKIKINHTNSIMSKLEVLLLASKAEDINNAIDECFVVGGRKAPSGLPMKKKMMIRMRRGGWFKRLMQFLRVVIYLVGLGFLIHIVYQWGYLNL